MSHLDLLITYDVAGVPDLQVGVTDTGQIALVIATESVTMADPAQLAMLEQVLEQARVDQARIYEERFPPEPDTEGLGPNQIGILRSLAGVSMAGPRDQYTERPYPGGGWVWDTDSRTRRLLDSLVRRRLVRKDYRRYRLTAAGHGVLTGHVPDYEARRTVSG